MCRMMAAVTAAPAPLSRVLHDVREPFTALAETHKDGWGVSSGEGPQLELAKSTAQALGDPAYEEALDFAEGSRFIVHIRRASAGTALSLENTHPFTEVSSNDGALALSHHGQFALTDAVRDAILASARERGGREPQGGTDTELYFALITAHAAAKGVKPSAPLTRWALAVQRAAREVTRIVREHAGEEPEALNTLLLTPRGLVAYQQWDESLRGKYKAPDTYQLRYLVDPAAGRVLVTSQGWDQSAYTDFEQGQAITVEQGSLRLTRYDPLGVVPLR